jgi:sugar lactone lactonase YvrE
MAALACFTGNAFASLLYGVQFDQTTPLFAIDQATGAIAAIGNTAFNNVADLTSDPLTNHLWGVEIGQGRLLTFDPHNGATTRTVQIDIPQPIVSIAFDPLSRMLYGNTAVGFGTTSSDTLYRIDPVTGHATSVGIIGTDRVYALGFDQNGTLYGVSDQTKTLMSISTATGQGTAVMSFDKSGATSVFDLATRPQDNAMFVADTKTFSLYRVDPLTGTVELVGPYGSDTNVVGLAFLSTAPEPSTWLTMGAGLAGLLAVRRRR